MSFIDGVVLPVLAVNREKYLAYANETAEVFREFGADAVIDCWGDDVPEGELTSFPKAVKLEPGEVVVFSWVHWPSRAVRDAAWPKIMADPRMRATKMPFDGKRMIYGGFDAMQQVARPARPQRVSTCLWFDRQAEEAATFYISLFAGSGITSLSRYGKDQRLPEGLALALTFDLAGTEYMALNGGPMFTHSEAASIVVNCDSQAEIDRLWSLLTADGGKAVQCGWLKDKYGISWQIVPARLKELMGTGDQATSERVIGALMQMVKLDIAALEAAAGKAA